MKLKKQQEIISLNDNLFSEMFLQELENRLETDPLMPNGLVDLVGDSSVSPLCTCTKQPMRNVTVIKQVLFLNLLELLCGKIPHNNFSVFYKA